MAPASDQSTAKAATVEEGPHHSQLLKRSNSPPWKKALVLDCGRQAVNIQSDRDIGQSLS